MTQPEHQTLSGICPKAGVKSLKVNEKVVDILYVYRKVLNIARGRCLVQECVCSIDERVHQCFQLSGLGCSQ